MANGYKAGNLNVEVLGISNKATSSIDKVISRLNALQTAINAINVSKFATISSSITAMGSAFSSFNLKNISSLSTRLNNFGKKIASMDFTSVKKGFDNLTTAITPFIDKVISAENSLRLLNETLTKVSGKKLSNLSNYDKSPKGKDSAFSFLNIAKWSAVIFAGRRLGQTVADIAQYGADYTETLNLWETSMGSNLNIATKFVNKMNEAYGISEKTLMNAQAIFKNMLGSLGQINDTMAYQLSEGITQMALDYASLYNQTFEQAFTKFQAALARQVRPIRSVAGYDITENTLFQLYQSLGGTKSMRQLSSTEKQLLSILAIFQQMERSGAVGDLNKTMESFANQSRVTAESWQQVLSYSGVLLTHLIQQSGLLTYVNGILIFIADALKAAAESIGAIKHFADPFESVTNGALDAENAINKVQGKLLDFDKFRSMSGEEETAFGLDEKLLNAFSNYDTILANASMSAKTIADNLKIASGLFNEDGTFNKNKWDELVSKIKAFGVALGGIVSIITTIKIASIIKKALSLFSIIKESIALISLAKTAGLTLAQTAESVGGVNKGVLGLSNIIKLLISPLGIVLSLASYLFVTNEEFRKSIIKIVNVALKPFVAILAVTIKVFSVLLKAINAIIQPIGTIISKIVDFLDKAKLLEPLIYGIIGAIAFIKITSWINSLGGLVTVIVKVTSSISMLAVKMAELARTTISKWAETIKTQLSTLTKQAFLTQTIGIAGLTASIAGLVSMFQNWGDMETWQKVIGLLGVITTAALGAAMAFGAFHSAWSIGLASAGIIAGIGAIIASISTIKKDINIPVDYRAQGGLPDKGTLFVAGEAGAEIVYNTPSGQSGVANIQQIAQATKAGTLQAVKEWWAQARKDIPQFNEVSKTGIYEITKSEMRRRGEW